MFCRSGVYYQDDVVHYGQKKWFHKPDHDDEWPDAFNLEVGVDDRLFEQVTQNECPNETHLGAEHLDEPQRTAE
jgi:hypothetical protein